MHVYTHTHTQTHTFTGFKKSLEVIVENPLFLVGHRCILRPNYQGVINNAGKLDFIWKMKSLRDFTLLFLLGLIKGTGTVSGMEELARFIKESVMEVKGKVWK